MSRLPPRRRRSPLQRQVFLLSCLPPASGFAFDGVVALSSLLTLTFARAFLCHHDSDSSCRVVCRYFFVIYAEIVLSFCMGSCLFVLTCEFR